MGRTTEILFQETRNYKSFKKLPGHRQINPEHVKKLKKLITRKEVEAKRIITFDPVIVNEKMQVVDGQHRIEAAKQLGCAISFIVLEGYGIYDAVVQNSITRITTRQNPTVLDFRADAKRSKGFAKSYTDISRRLKILEAEIKRRRRKVLLEDAKKMSGQL